MFREQGRRDAAFSIFLDEPPMLSAAIVSQRAAGPILKF
jgi:hypothetical protein